MCTQEKNHFLAATVIRDLHRQETDKHMKEFIVERGHSFVHFATNVLFSHRQETLTSKPILSFVSFRNSSF